MCRSAEAVEPGNPRSRPPRPIRRIGRIGPIGPMKRGGRRRGGDLSRGRKWDQMARCLQFMTISVAKEPGMRTNFVLVSSTVFLAAAGIIPAAAAQEKKSTQEPKSFEKEITIMVKFNYLLFLPEGYESSEKKWPLILFLHGGGETGNEIEKVKATGLPKLLETKRDFPFVVISPQSAPRGMEPGRARCAAR